MSEAVVEKTTKVENPVTKNNKNDSNSTDNDLDFKTLFVRSIPLDTTDGELADYFSNFAPIRHAVIVKDDQKRSRGFGFVTFAVEEDTKEALKQARKTKLKNHLIRVDIAKRRDRNKTKASSEQISNDQNSEKKQVIDNHGEYNNDNEDPEDSEFKGKPKLIIRNMPWSCRDPIKLKKIFSRFGNVVDASIPRKRDGKLCGFAFVTMKKISNCRIALENTKDLKIDGRAVAVDFAIQKNRWEDYKKTHNDIQEEDQKDDSSTSESSNSSDSSSDNDSNDDDTSDSDIELDDDEEVTEEENKIEQQEKSKQNRREDFSVFVRNVPYDASEESLVEHFTKFGPVKYALPVIDRETGLAKGTAFVAFRNKDAYEKCVTNAPAAGSTSLLIGDDVLPEYVYEGRVLSVTPTLDRENANRMAEKNAEKRKVTLGKAPTERDKRNMYLLNEGKIVEGTKLAQLLSKTDMEVREKSYNLRVEQLKKNPSLHLSMTRLAIRNIPRAMTEKSLKALGRRAVVEFATEVKNGVRHQLSKEEIQRSTKEKYKFMTEEQIEQQKKKDKKQGLVRQAKIIMEVKGSTIGRSRGYGFIEYRDHKSALMGLRWLNAHKITTEEILEGLTDDEKKSISTEQLQSRRLVVEFAIENANVVKRRRENTLKAREGGQKRTREDDNDHTGGYRGVPRDDKKSDRKGKRDGRPAFKKGKFNDRTDKMQNNDRENRNKSSKKDSGLSDDVKKIIGMKRKRRNTRK
ncbi:hypothetical protein TBLA_0A01570 [Henningerozyma blattae CBS 6284]|uniref:RRM domain-containing protein n=1 Tax=Henningerozyma blattae (strain ATCC 34711 / CBS 6284 / DSM 70876 / NBRC 10599 / NRRL Y-10934 / UCD 77-7) TaxID=1071380 RepID=I2GV04_HENB6|nr:hypothetical protein TBLA_0A01570 [Tetrapisispora blattae CBS 6284]CCH57956.1 hypothetical protein TBLA_0A01570 [Tetrapisispora blattae CBS 6284]